MTDPERDKRADGESLPEGRYLCPLCQRVKEHLPPFILREDPERPGVWYSKQCPRCWDSWVATEREKRSQDSDRFQGPGRVAKPKTEPPI